MIFILHYPMKDTTEVSSTVIYRFQGVFLKIDIHLYGIAPMISPVK